MPEHSLPAALLPSHASHTCRAEKDSLTGNNVVYKRTVLARHHEVIDEHKWENRLHDAETLVRHAEVTVDHKKPFRVRRSLGRDAWPPRWSRTLAEQGHLTSRG